MTKLFIHGGPILPFLPLCFHGQASPRVHAGQTGQSHYAHYDRYDKFYQNDQKNSY